MSMKKYTIDGLKKLGYRAYQVNNMTGHVLEANYPFDHVEYVANHCPERLRFTRDLIGGKVRVHIIHSPAQRVDFFIERDMAEDELEVAAVELAGMGVTACV